MSSSGSGTSMRPLKLTDPEVRALCWSRDAADRFPDLVAQSERKHEAEGAPLSAQDRKRAALAFIAYIQECEDSGAELRILNNVDFESHPPLDFAFAATYVRGSPALTDGAHRPHGCACDDDDCDPRSCSCLDKARELDPDTWASHNDFAYDSNGRLREEIAPDTVIWECNSRCGCASDCRNRQVQHGRRYGLTLFKTPTKGWGLRAIEAIPARSFVFTYTGELLDSNVYRTRGDVYDKVGRSYLLALDCWHVKIETQFRPVNKKRAAAGLPPLKFDSEEMRLEAAKARPQDPMLTVDAAFWGSLARFLNHSCEPNLRMHPVHYGEDAGYIIRPYMAFFTTRDVAPGEELTFSYSGDVDEAELTQLTQDPDLPSIGAQRCLCGARQCRGNFWR